MYKRQEKNYVRVTPYDKRKGALAARVTLGGRVFEAGQWYTLSPTWCQKIAPLRQESGAPYFEIMSAAVFAQTAQAETLAMMRAQGIAGLASHGAIPGMPTPRAQNTGPKTSAFAGMDAESTEVSLAEGATGVVVASSPEPEIELPRVAERVDDPAPDAADDDSDEWD